jgi:hypothetical protein
MRIKAQTHLLLVAVIATMFFSSCNNSNKPVPLTTSSGTSIQDTMLPKVLVKLVHTGTANYLAYYFTNSLVVDTTHTPPVLTLYAQSARYDSTNDSYVLHNGSTTSQVSSQISLNTDTVIAYSAGPFDPVAGQFYTKKGYLHYCSKTVPDTTICPIASVVYYNQNGSGQPVIVGYVSQEELHSPKPPVHN